MISNAIAGKGTGFYRWNGSSAWAAISEVTSIGGPSMSRDMIEVTTMDAEDYKEYISGLRDSGTISLSLNYTKAGFNIMKTDFEDDNPQNYKIVLPDTENFTLEFEGYVSEVPLTIEINDKIMMEVTIQISGKVEVYDGSSGSPVVS